MTKQTLTLLLSIIISATGCSFWEGGITTGHPRSYYERSRNKADSVKTIKGPGDSAGGRASIDTNVFISAVRCSPDYDWKRDSAYGCPSAEILLIKNGVALLSIPVKKGSCTSAAPDRHHILNGSLYTEFCDYSKTVVGRDGQELFRVNGREILRGLCVKDEDVYTLSEKVSGNGLVLRKNGEIEFNVSGAEAFGGFDDPSYGQTGALYEDDEKICFAYRKSSRCYIVRNCEENAVSGAGSQALDVKSVGGRDIAAYSWSLGHRWKDARIWRNGSTYLLSGQSADGYSERLFLIVDENTRWSDSFVMDEGLIYYKEGTSRAIDRKQMGSDNYYFSSRCATLLGSDLMVLHNPKDGGTPYLEYGKKKTVFDDTNLYLTGITAEINLPRQ